MKLLKFAPLLLVLAACAPPVQNATRSAGGGTQVQVVNGDNCHNGMCFHYNASRNTVTAVGRRPAPVPANFKPSGYVSEAQYSALFDEAQRAEVVKGGSDR